MKIKITNHAKGRMKEYEISEGLLNQALNNPDSIIEGAKGRKIYQKKLNGHILRAVVEEGKEINTLVTVYKARSKRYGI